MTQSSTGQGKSYYGRAIIAGLVAGIIAGVVADLIVGLVGLVIGFIAGFTVAARTTLNVSRAREQET